MLGKKRYGLAVLTILLVGSSIVIAQQTTTRVRPAGPDLVVIDNTGKNLGPVIGVAADGTTTVAFSFRGKALPISVFRALTSKGYCIS